MTRVSEGQIHRSSLKTILDNKKLVEQYSNEVATGIKAQAPGDSNYAGSITQFQEQLSQIEQYKNTSAEAKSQLQFQENVINSASDIMIRLKEIGTQAANETNSPSARSQLAEEVFQIRDQLANLGNSTYKGRYIFGGADDDDPPFDPTTYATPATGPESQRYVWDNEIGTNTTRTVEVADGVSITLNTPGNNLFSNAISAAERLGRSLKGYATTPATGAPNGGGAAYTFPTDFSLQTKDIAATLDQMDQARNADLIPEQNRIGGKLKRIETGESLLDLTKQTTQEVLDRLQGADEAESATKLSLAQSALQASYSVTAKTLKLTILDYL